MSETTAELERYLRENIPLSAAMGVRAFSVDAAGVRLGAPLEPNLNHRGTAFGGSLASLVTLSALAMVHTGLRDAGIDVHLVIQRSSMEYLKPVDGDFEAFCPTPDPAEWERFLGTLRRRGRARIVVRAELCWDGERVGSFQGSFVATVRPEGEGGP